MFCSIVMIGRISKHKQLEMLGEMLALRCCSRELSVSLHKKMWQLSCHLYEALTYTYFLQCRIIAKWTYLCCCFSHSVIKNIMNVHLIKIIWGFLDFFNNLCLIFFSPSPVIRINMKNCKKMKLKKNHIYL